MPNRVTKTCPECGNTFSVIPSQATRRVYCSRECQKSATHWTSQVCPQCEKPFTFHPSAYPNGRIHCSFECRKAASRVTTICPGCGKEFWYHHNRPMPRKYCSRACASRHTGPCRPGVPRPDLRRERPEWRKQVDLVCEICSKPFSVQVNEAKGRRFCSNTCRYKWQETALAGSDNRNSMPATAMAMPVGVVARLSRN